MPRPLLLATTLWLLAVPALGNDSFLKQHCLDCHSGESAEASLRLDALRFDLERPEVFEQWVKVFDRVQSGEMPPKDAEQPADESRQAMLRSLARQLEAADRARQQTAGRVVYRRLNRVEYENTLRDLLAQPHLQIAHMLPADPEAHGFDNVSAALRISYVHINRYLDAAAAALAEAAWVKPPPTRYKFRLPFVEIHRFCITKDRATVNNEAVLLRQPNTAQTPWRIDAVEIPFPGTHTVRIRGRAVTYQQDQPDQGNLLPPTSPQILSVYQGTRLLGSIDLTGKSTVGEITAHLYPREQLQLYVPTLDARAPKWTKGDYMGEAVALEWIEIEGPVETDWPAESHRILFGDLPIMEWTEDSGFAPPAEIGELKHPKRFPKLELPNRRTRYMVVSEHPTEDARRLLEKFLVRAFRRPVPVGELERYLQIVQRQLDRKQPFHAALLEGYRAALCSPDFLFYHELPGKLDGYALASRLSYFLWKSMPDEVLRELAADGRVAQPEVLRAQVDRMLADPRSQRMIEDFTGQWLDLYEINFTEPDNRLYPEYDEFLKESMVAETHAYVRKMIAENLPARHVVDSDIVIVNNKLAEIYNLDGVEGVALREVKLREGSPRGGLLTQASILKVTANGTTTSPVVRGAWVLEHLLGQPAPLPPPNVPAIDPDTRGTSTIRERLAKHRSDPVCASCHAKIDPPGFALENFDVIGSFRQRYRSNGEGDPAEAMVRGRPVRYLLGPAVDATGQIESGAKFQDIHEFKQLLLKDERQIARNLVQRLMVYGTGAQVSFADRAVVEQILDEARTTQYGLRTMIHGVVQSRVFREK